MYRTILFWIHLSAAILAGAVILIMSITGVLLAYQRQITNFVDRKTLPVISAPNTSMPMPIEDLLAKLSAKTHQTPTAITVQSAPGQPYSIDFGRDRTVFVEPDSGTIVGEASQRTRRFFRSVTDWHRWLAFRSESRTTGRAITGASNLIFLGIVLSGMYLWLPKKWTCEMRARRQSSYPSVKYFVDDLFSLVDIDQHAVADPLSFGLLWQRKPL